jgi:hypothetical protein
MGVFVSFSGMNLRSAYNGRGGARGDDYFWALPLAVSFPAISFRVTAQGAKDSVRIIRYGDSQMAIRYCFFA